MDRRTDSPDLAVSSETVVEHVRVLAVGSEIKRPKPNGVTSETAVTPARTVTLEVTPRMGEVVAVAARLGSLSLALCRFDTETRDPNATAAVAASSAEREPIWAGDISRAVRALPYAPARRLSPRSARPRRQDHRVRRFARRRRDHARAQRGGVSV